MSTAQRMTEEPEGLALAVDRAGWTVLAPDEELAIDATEWRQALVLVQRGIAKVTCSAGQSALFGAGSVLCLDGPAMRSIAAAGESGVVLMTLRRCADSAPENGEPAPTRLRPRGRPG